MEGNPTTEESAVFAGETHCFETEAIRKGEVGAVSCVCLLAKSTGKLHVRFDEGEG